MRATTIVTAVMAAGAVIFGARAARATEVCNAPSGLNLRTYPSLHAPVARTLGDGTSFDRVGRTSPNGRWQQVRVGGRTGWVSTDYTCSGNGGAGSGSSSGASAAPARGDERRAVADASPADHWKSPVPGFCVTSPYGRRNLGGRGEFHPGLDIGAPCGTPVRPTAPGRVIFAGWKGGYGNAVMVQHANGLVTLYGHNSHLRVHPGQSVDQNTVLSISGSTGRSTGCHVHFEVRNGPNGSTRDPRTLIGYARCPTTGGAIDGSRSGTHR